MSIRTEARVPVAPKRPHSITQHGETRVDSYFWMRYREDPAVLDYLNVENGYCEDMTAHTKPLREKLYAEMRGRIKESDVSVPEKRGDYFYYTRTEAGQQYRVHCRKHLSLDAPEQVILNENALAAGHAYFKVGVFELSPDQRWLAYSVDLDGDEVYSLLTKDLNTGEILGETIPNTTYGLAWANDNQSFFYVTLDASKRAHKVFRHVLGMPVTDDACVFHEPDELWTTHIGKTDDDAFILIGSFMFGSSEARFLSADTPEGHFTVFQLRQPNIEYSLEHHDGRFLIVTNENAQDFKLLVTPDDQIDKIYWRQVIPHRPGVLLQAIRPQKDFIVRFEREAGLKHIRYTTPDFANEQSVAFPEPSYTFWAHPNREFDSHILRFSYTSLVTPSSVVDYDLAASAGADAGAGAGAGAGADAGDDAWQVRKQDEIPSGYDDSQYEAERVWATAPDGTQVPISLVHRKDVVQPGPLLLYGYGSYGSSIDPSFNTSRLSLLDRGVTFAIAHIRGGSEMGRAWYDNGKLMNKKNTFADFIACAEYFIAQGYTSKDQLVIQGKSAGGLLMGAVMTMRPDLFCAVIADVPFVDVISTMSDASIPLTAQEWEQWGNPDDKTYFDYMKSYSPYDNIKATQYPALLLKAGLNDPRVQYWEPAKFAAKLREMKTDTHPLLLQTHMNAGHFGSSGRFDFLEEVAFDYAFVLDQFDIST